MGNAVEINIAAEQIRAMRWPGSNRYVRVVWIEQELWCVAADLCWATGLALSSNGRPNVTEALKTIAPKHRRFARLEVARGSFRPFTCYALTTMVGVEEIVERKRIQAGEVSISEGDLRAWLARSAAQTCQMPSLKAA